MTSSRRKPAECGEAAAEKARAYFMAVDSLGRGRALIAEPTLEDLGAPGPGGAEYSRGSRFQRRAVSAQNPTASSMARGALLSDAVQTTETESGSVVASLHNLNKALFLVGGRNQTGKLWRNSRGQSQTVEFD
jgi:hypothetical protein